MEADGSSRSRFAPPRNPSFDLDAFVASHFPDAKPEPWGDGGTRWILDPCPFNDEHRGTSSAILRTESGVIAFRCLHNGCADRGWKDLRAMFDESTEGAGSGKMSPATLLVNLASSCRKFHSPDRTAYVDLEQDGHRETWKVRSAGFRQWLKKEYWREYQLAPSGQAMTDAIGVIEAMAIYDGSEIPVHLRIAENSGDIYLDLCDSGWRAVKIDAKGWTVVSDSPVRCRRESGMLALPEPVAGGSLEPLRKLLHVAGDAWVLLMAWAVGAFNPKMPLAVLVLVGPQGATKSTRTRLLRGLVDPHVAPLRSLPRDERDLVIAANRNYALCLDNVSHLPVWLSDALCRISTGGGFGTRELYTDTDEIVFNSLRPLVLNGIEQFATRGDLLDRSLVIELDPLPEHLRREEREVKAEYEEALPGLLGALLDGVSAALRNRDEVTVEKLPRMADFARWVTAAEEGLGFESGAFLQAFRRNKTETHDLAVEASPIGTALIELIGRRRNGWTGTATQLLGTLAEEVKEEARRARSWPKNGKVLSDVLRRIVPDLGALGIKVTFHKRDRREGRLISIDRVSPSPSSSASQTASEGDSRRDEPRDKEEQAQPDASREPLAEEEGDERDGRDEEERNGAEELDEDPEK